MEAKQWKTIGVVVGAVLLLVVFVAQLRDAGTDRPAGPVVATTTSTTNRPRVTAVNPSASTMTGNDADVDDHPVTDEDGLLKTVNGFAKDFATDGSDWLARVGRWCIPALADKLSTIDPGNVPETGKVTEVKIVSPTEPVATVDVTYASHLRLRLLLIYAPGGWKVMSYDRA